MLRIVGVFARNVANSEVACCSFNVPSYILRKGYFIRFITRSSSLLTDPCVPNCFRAACSYDLCRLSGIVNVRSANERSRNSRNGKNHLPSNNGASSDVEKEGKQEGQEEGDQKQKPDNDFKIFVIRAYLIAFGLIFLLASFYRRDDVKGELKEITWSDFVNRILPTGQIAKIAVYGDVAVVQMYAGAKTAHGEELTTTFRVTVPSVSRFEAEVRAAERANNLPPELWTRIEYRDVETFQSLLLLILFATTAIVGYRYFKGKFSNTTFNFRQMMNQATSNKLNIIDPHGNGKKLKIKFKDVAGLHEAKIEIKEFVDYLRNPLKYTKLGAKLPKGALLTGPPGCGKTLLAKALAAESSTPFISINGTEFVEVIGGLGASRIRNLFAEARARAPCIVYIDEIDAVGRKRSDGGSAGDSEADQTLNQLLVEMDGIDSAKGIIVLASTNRGDILDKALLRPGRFDRHILIDHPTAIERKEMFELYLGKIKLDHEPSHYSQRLAQMTPGFSGADIRNVVNEAAINAASNQKPMVTAKELDYSLQRVLAGSEKRTQTLVKEEKEIVAYHEAGHALVGWLLEHTDALLKVSILPRTNAALGFSQYNTRDRKLFSTEELFDRMCMMLGGRAAENIVFGRITTGAQDDLDKVTKSAYAQVKVYGMSKKLGPLSFPSEPDSELNADFLVKPYSSKLQHDMDQEASSLVSQAYFKTEEILRNNRTTLDKLAKKLLEKEVLSYEDVKALIGPPKFGDKQVIELSENLLPSPSGK